MAVMAGITNLVIIISFAYVSALLMGAHMYWKRSAARSLLNLLPSKCKLLDIGCGTGDMLRIFYKENPGARLTGLDFSPKEELCERAEDFLMSYDAE